LNEFDSIAYVGLYDKQKLPTKGIESKEWFKQ
jgi:hypothetical protein